MLLIGLPSLVRVEDLTRGGATLPDEDCSPVVQSTQKQSRRFVKASQVLDLQVQRQRASIERRCAGPFQPQQVSGPEMARYGYVPPALCQSPRKFCHTSPSFNLPATMPASFFSPIHT